LNDPGVPVEWYKSRAYAHRFTLEEVSLLAEVAGATGYTILDMESGYFGGQN
jgi:hypothetical protein